MTYNPAIPGPTDLISQSQAQIQTNFSQADTIFDIDHVTFDNSTAGDRGKHRHSTYVEQSVNPTTAVNEVALYSKDLGGVETLYLRKESNGTVIQMSGQDPTNANPGSTFLPGGIVLKWGTPSLQADNATINFVSSFPNNCLAIQLTVISATASSTLLNIKDGSLSTSGFSIRSSGTVSFHYYAIGN